MALKGYQLTGVTAQEEHKPVELGSRLGYEFAKRIFDIVFSAIFTILGLPFIIICGLLMKLESQGPMFYAQQRVGKNGREFTVYKLRSMPKNAEANGPVITCVDGDSRPGRIGRFIRKSKIDELPQFLNVLRGEMSVIGPRPERPYFVEKFTQVLPNFGERHLVKPGITGLAQIKEKDSFQIKSKLQYDLFYIEHRSFSCDMWILWHTIWFCFHYLLIGLGFIENNNGNNNHGPNELT